MRFWLEWDRGTMHARDLTIKFTSYAHSIASRESARELSMLPLLICIASSFGSPAAARLALPNCPERPPREAPYSLANMQVWSEPASAPDHEFVCFEPTVNSEDALNRPADRLNIASHSSRQIVLQLIAKPL